MKIRVFDSVIMISGKVSAKFPSYPKTNETYTLKSSQGATDYTLNLQRVNYSDIKIVFTIKENSGIVFEAKSTLAISPGFINGAGMYDDEATGGSYPAYGYESYSNNFPTSIIVSLPMGSEKELRAKIIGINCMNEKVRLLVEEMPTLRTKIR